MIVTPDISRLVAGLPDAAADHPAIARFIDEIREAAKVRGLITEEHIEVIRVGLASAYHAAGDSAEMLDFWDEAHTVITQRKSVRERLLRIGRIGELLEERYRGRMN